ncbi:MAG: DUF4395 family protein [Rhodobacteraceae bacterium]|nr:DUF4395 family protein [Paracoccaceae bacterium]
MTTARLFQFGEEMAEYPVRVLNEREARAGAGLLFLVASIAFVRAMGFGDFTLTRVVILGFFLEFAIRVLVNPRFAPSLVIGRLIVGRQEPEYVGAPQKRFAWALGLAMATAAMVLVFGLNMAGPALMLLCVTCLALLFMETAFGICVGCKLFALIAREKAQMCPGGVCSFGGPAPITRVTSGHLVAVAAVAAVLAAALPAILAMEQPWMPEFARAYHGQ